MRCIASYALVSNFTISKGSKHAGSLPYAADPSVAGSSSQQTCPEVLMLQYVLCERVHGEYYMRVLPD